MAPYRLPSCSCAKVETRTKTTYGAGGSITGAQLTILKWAYGAHGPAFARTAIAFHATATTFKVPGHADKTDPDLYGRYFVDLRRVGAHWVISAIRFMEVPAP
jgi:hypothetical protein